MTDRVASRGVHQRNWLLLGEATGVVAVSAYLMAVDPHDPRVAMPTCPVKLLTGLDCPACGGLRLAHDVLHRDVRAGLHDNPFLLLCSPLLAYLVGLHVHAVLSDRTVHLPRPPAYTLAGAALAWMVVRNLPWWPLTPRTSR